MPGGRTPPPFLARRVRRKPAKGGPIPHLEDTDFRSRIISVAATSMSRRGVAAACGIASSTLVEWIQRGLAYPSDEPWGSFARDYRQAERGIELAAQGTKAALVAHLYRLVKREEWGAICALYGDLPSAMRMLTAEVASRYPADHGTTAHRVPEPELTGEAWIERNGLTQAQLGAMISDPPEPLRDALVSNADTVYALLLASGWSPRAMAAE